MDLGSTAMELDSMLATKEQFDDFPLRTNL